MNTIKGVDKFSDAFWRFIKEQIGIKYIYPESRSYLKKKLSFEERQEKVEQMFQKVKVEDEDLLAQDLSLDKWSDEAAELNSYIKKLGLMPDICADDYLINFFETLYFQRMGIQRIDETLQNMSNLVVLNLSFNRLSSINFLPKSLKELYLTGNQIYTFENPVHSNLIHLALAYNQIDYYQFVQICRIFPNLFCLDTSFNNVTDLLYVISCLNDLASIKMLYLIGNPCALTPQYRDIIKQNLERLKMIDGIPAYTESESPNKRKKKALLAGIDKNIEIQRTGTLDFQLRVLQNIDGIYLNEEQCKLEILDQLSDEQKSSVFWLKYTTDDGYVVESERKIWIQHFQVDKETNIGKTDFGYKVRKELQLDAQRRDWIRNDVLVELWESRPRIREKKHEDETITKEVVLGEDNWPIIDTKLRGIMVVSLSDWVNKVELTQEDLQTHSRLFFFESKYIETPEFMFENQYAKLKDTDQQLLVGWLAQQEDIEKLKHAQSEEALKQPVAGGKPGGKVDPKKDPKGAQAQKKGIVVEDKNAPKPIVIDYPETHNGHNFVILEKNYNSMRQGILGSLESAGQASLVGSKKPQGVQKDLSIDEKKSLRLKEIQETYQIIRALPFSLAVKTRLNLPEEIIVVKQPDPIVDPKKKK